MALSRRDLLAGAAGGAAAVGVAAVAGSADTASAGPTDHSLGVDRIVRTTCSPNCTGSCGQLAFVRNERIVKIQQAADYPEVSYRPRGCMKGLSYHQLIYGDDRITTPLIRTGPRGSGEFRTATWDEALDKVADGLRAIGEKAGWDAIHVFGQVPGSGYVQKGAAYRACALLGMTHGTSFDFNGDLPMGMPITFGVQNAEHESKDWANSRFLLVVGANLLETRIPDAHFVFDAVADGAHLIVVDPVYSATATKADNWLQINAGTDAAFGLSLASVIVAENLVDEAFMRTYTDAPLLVRADTGTRLRESDLSGQVAPGGDATSNRYLVWDENADQPVPVSGELLGIPDGVEAALDGSHRVTLASGQVIDVSPSFRYVRQELDNWTPEKAQSITGLDPALVRKVAKAYATTEPAAILMGGGANHWYHGDLAGRAFALCAALTGNIGKSGGGFSVYVGQYKVRVRWAPWVNPDDKKAKIVPSIYFLGGPTETMHPDIPYPKSGYKGLVCTFSNMMVQSPDLNRLYKTLDELELIVVVDHQKTDTVAYADVVLPAASWYEKKDLTATPLHPYLQLQQETVKPLGESRPELWMWREIVRRIDPAMADKYFALTEDDAIRLILGAGGPTEGITLDQLEKGPVRLKVPDPDVAFVEQIRDRKPFPPVSLPAAIEATRKFVPTGRIEFYKDEERFRELHEQVPTYKKPFDDGVNDPEKYPLRLLSPHSKWRIHSTYSNVPWLTEIHGGKPQVLIHPADADKRGVRDGDRIEVANGRGRVVAWANVSEAAGRGTATLTEGWWPRYFDAGKGVNELTSSAVNPIHEIHFVANMWSPSTGWKDCLCEVRRV